MGIGYHTKFTLEQYKQILEYKRMREAIPTTDDLSKMWGIKRSTIISAARKGVKKYDYILARERAAKMKEDALQRSRDKEAKAQGVLKEVVRSQQKVGVKPGKETQTRVSKEVVRV